jgi:hypothetical protein
MQALLEAGSGARTAPQIHIPRKLIQTGHIGIAKISFLI